MTQTSTWHLQSHLHTNNNTHWASLLPLKGARSLGLIVHSPTWVIPASVAVPPLIHTLGDFTNALHISSQILVLRSPSSSPTSIFWQAPGHSYSSTSQHSPRCYRSSSSHMQGLWAHPAYVPPVLPLQWPPASACQSRDNLVLCYFPSRCQMPPAQNNFHIPIWGESAAHLHGPVRPTKRCSLAAQRPPGHTYPV